MGGDSGGRRRAPPWAVALVAVVWLVAVVSVLAGLVLLVWPDGPMPPHGFGSPAGDGLVALAYAAGASVGALIAIRRPELSLGWIMLAAGFFTATASGLSEYYTLARNYGLPGYVQSAWYGAWAWELGAGLAVSFALLLFPTGRLPSPRWRVVAVISGLLLAVLALSQALAPGPLAGEFRLVWNPLGLQDVRWLKDVRDSAWVILFALTGLSGLALGARYRRAGAIERAQLKWLSYAACLTGVALVARSPLMDDTTLWAQTPLILGVTSFPVAFGIAVLRYRLFDIQRLVSRTVSYSLLTVVLGAVYATAALLAARTLAPFAPGSTLSVALATLVAAAVFRPARVRIQDAVDRRFNRARFDGARTVEAFREDLRSKQDLEAIVDSLLESVTGTMEPAATSVWLPPPPDRDRRPGFT